MKPQTQMPPPRKPPGEVVAIAAPGGDDEPERKKEIVRVPLPARTPVTMTVTASPVSRPAPHVESNRRLWLVFSCILFVAPWITPMIGAHPEMPALWYPISILSIDPSWTPLHTGAALLLFGTHAILIGWALQRILVLLKHKRGATLSAA